MKRPLVAAAGACLLVTALIAGPASGGTAGPVYAPQDCVKPAVEPKKITLTCADSGNPAQEAPLGRVERGQGEGRLTPAGL